MIIIVYVDDMGVAAINNTLIDELITFLRSRGLDLQREGTFQDYLGIRFSALPNGSVHMTQMGLIKKIITTLNHQKMLPQQNPAQALSFSWAHVHLSGNPIYKLKFHCLLWKLNTQHCLQQHVWYCL